jgi:hypothetical protein
VIGYRFCSLDYHPVTMSYSPCLWHQGFYSHSNRGVFSAILRYDSLSQ